MTMRGLILHSCATVASNKKLYLSCLSFMLCLRYISCVKYEIDDLQCGSILGISGPNCLNSAPFMHMMYGCNLSRVQDKKNTGV
jgi:hypothetical protein